MKVVCLINLQSIKRGERGTLELQKVIETFTFCFCLGVAYKVLNEGNVASQYLHKIHEVLKATQHLQAALKSVVRLSEGF